jgi:hypothetical protein
MHKKEYKSLSSEDIYRLYVPDKLTTKPVEINMIDASVLNPNRIYSDIATSNFVSVFFNSDIAPDKINNAQIFLNYVYDVINNELDMNLNNEYILKYNKSLHPNDKVYFVFKGGNTLYNLFNVLMSKLATEGLPKLDQIREKKLEGEIQQAKALLAQVATGFKLSDFDFSVYVKLNEYSNPKYNQQVVVTKYNNIKSLLIKILTDVLFRICNVFNTKLSTNQMKPERISSSEKKILSLHKQYIYDEKSEKRYTTLLQICDTDFITIKRLCSSIILQDEFKQNMALILDKQNDCFNHIYKQCAVSGIDKTILIDCHQKFDDILVNKFNPNIDNHVIKSKIRVVFEQLNNVLHMCLPLIDPNQIISTIKTFQMLFNIFSTSDNKCDMNTKPNDIVSYLCAGSLYMKNKYNHEYILPREHNITHFYSYDKIQLFKNNLINDLNIQCTNVPRFARSDSTQKIYMIQDQISDKDILFNSKPYIYVMQTGIINFWPTPGDRYIKYHYYSLNNSIRMIPKNKSYVIDFDLLRIKCNIVLTNKMKYAIISDNDIKYNINKTTGDITIHYKEPIYTTKDEFLMPSEFIDVSVPAYNKQLIEHIMDERYNHIMFENIHFMGLSMMSYTKSYLIYDLSRILFMSTGMTPWLDTKYRKRVSRLIFLSMLQLYEQNKYDEAMFTSICNLISHLLGKPNNNSSDKIMHYINLISKQKLIAHDKHYMSILHFLEDIMTESDYGRKNDIINTFLNKFNNDTIMFMQGLMPCILYNGIIYYINRCDVVVTELLTFHINKMRTNYSYSKLNDVQINLHIYKYIREFLETVRAEIILWQTIFNVINKIQI